MKYASALRFLDSLVNYEKQVKPRGRFKLDNIRRLLELAGNPERRLENVILVAGTKGKGSVCYMLEAALRGCGLRTGLFVSPHVSTVRERIQLNGGFIAKQHFGRLVERFRPLVRRQPVSYFELLTAIAFDAFARSRPDYAVVEVGLGGRLDATNLSEPAVSVITRIGLDHVQVLGNTVRKIAREKAGIMRAGRPIVIGPQVPAAASELERRTRTTEAQRVLATERVRYWDQNCLPNGVSFSMLSELGAGRVVLPLLGRHQVENCLTALAVLGLLVHNDQRISLAGIEAGLRRVEIPGRCQLVRHDPPVLVDSCHNPDSGRALADTIAIHLRKKVILVYGSLRGKLIRETVAPLVPWVEQAVLVRPESPRAEALADLGRVFGRLKLRHIGAGCVARGLERALGLAGSETPVVVAGSFYVAGEALSCLGVVRNRNHR